MKIIKKIFLLWGNLLIRWLPPKAQLKHYKKTLCKRCYPVMAKEVEDTQKMAISILSWVLVFFVIYSILTA